MLEIAHIRQKLHTTASVEELVAAGRVVVPSVVWLLRHDTETAHRRNAAIALGSLADERATIPLSWSLRHDEPMVRESAAVALGNIGGPDGVRPLLAALGDNTAIVRKFAGRSLVQIGIPAVEPLIQELWDPRRNIRESVLDTLARIGTPAIVPLLRTYRYSKGRAQRDAITTLHRIGTPAALPDAILRDSRLPARQKTETLFALFSYLRRRDLRAFCLAARLDTDPLVVAGAFSVLADLDSRTLLRPSQRSHREEPRSLLRPASPHLYYEPAESLLRPLD